MTSISNKARLLRMWALRVKVCGCSSSVYLRLGVHVVVGGSATRGNVKALAKVGLSAVRSALHSSCSVTCNGGTKDTLQSKTWGGPNYRQLPRLKLFVAATSIKSCLIIVDGAFICICVPFVLGR